MRQIDDPVLMRTLFYAEDCMRYLVIDEADRVMDSVDKSWMYQVELALRGNNGGGDPVWDTLTIANLEKHRELRPSFPQKLLFSATLSQNPTKLEEMGLFYPRLFTSVGADQGFIGKYSIPAELKEYSLECNLEFKPLVVYALVTRYSWSRVICFVGERESGRRLCQLLTKLGNVRAGELSSLLPKKSRSAMVKCFADGELDVLVTSDVMARGIDVLDVKYVICYDFSPHAKTYVHRVGRTARAGQSGTALSLLSEHEVGRFESVTAQLDRCSPVKPFDLNLESLSDLEDRYRDALLSLRKGVQAEDTAKLSAKKSAKSRIQKRMMLPTSSKKKRKKTKPTARSAKS
ncbi:unnamed protein product [Notodromas monacha]|uniref:ATP-dependent RNA helicase n=1 Tax=Notodromas monacha TaxID=399045 RepID=A0A7R9BR71_9CRUS|nr:unnamed protein product [Notodromas monacha]CAG0920159.1 unnamed protein product [Notodromas monacha]